MKCTNNSFSLSFIYNRWF